MGKESIGFIKLNRKIFEHWIFQDAEKFKSFVDIIQLARWRDEELLIGNDVVVVHRGSYYTSILKLADRWGWGRDKTRSFLSLLEKEGMIKLKTTTKGTMLTVENYRFYQDEHPTVYPTKTQRTNNEPDVKPTTNQHQTNIKPDTKEESKEIIRNYKKREEGKEVPKGSRPLSFPTNIHKEIFNLIGEVSYATWFMDSVIKDRGELLIIEVDKEFKKNIIQSKFVEKLNMQLKKKINIKLQEGV